MIESIRLWARYNLATDEKVNALLASLPVQAHTEPRSTYFKTLAGLHLHYVQTYRVYQTLIRKNTNNKYFVSPLTEEGYEIPAGPVAEVGRLALEYDRQYQAFVEQVSEAELLSPKTDRLMRNGKTYRLSLGDILTQYQNHTAHHRGQLSQLLDELGVEHDIGGLLVFAEEAKS